jgi:hypothetical protein
MALDYSKLTDFAACDKATKALEIERKSFLVRDLSLELADDRAGVSQSATAQQLAKVESKITSANVLLATPGIDPELVDETNDELAALLVRRTALLKRSAAAAAGAEFLTDVDAEQAAAQVAYLTTVIDGVAAHRATLSA